VYAAGGPTSVDSTSGGLAGLLDRSPADARGVKLGGAGGSRRATGEIGAVRRSTGDSGGRRATGEAGSKK
jgi:hypothetical protein